MAEVYESTLHIFREVHMYKIPPRASSKGYKYAAACRPARACCAPQR